MSKKVKMLEKALSSIAEYIEKVKPATLVEAEGMLALIGVIAASTLKEAKEMDPYWPPPSWRPGTIAD